MSASEEVRRREEDWRELLRGSKFRDVSTLLADGYTNTDADGNVWTRDVDIDNCISGRYKVKCLSDAEELEIRPCSDDCVIVTGRDAIIAKFNDKDVSGTYRWTDTWVKKSDGWQCVASHSSRVPV